MKVLVFGYSDNPDRYSYLAANLLNQFKHEVFKFNPRVDDPKDLSSHKFDTLTLYVSDIISNKFQDVLLGLDFKRVIFNPGTENIELEKKLIKMNIEVIHGCTLVMLNTGQF